MTATLNATLTERYVAATVRHLPADAQEDVRAELETAITDAVESRVEQGDEPAEAERAVLTDLGNPVVLAAGYAERPLHLIGPRYYLTWWRLLKLLLLIIPVAVMALAAFGQVLAGRPVGALIGESIGAGITTAVHVCVWVTVVFAILERTGAAALTPWHVDQLPEPQPATVSRSEPIGTLIFLGLMAGAVLWDQLRGFIPADGETVSILNPGLWPWGIAALLALFAIEATMVVVLYARGFWTSAHAVANTVLNVLIMSWALTLLGRGQLINTELLEPAFFGIGIEQEVLRILSVLIGFGVVGVCGWDIVDGWLKQRRAAHRRSIGVETLQ